MKLHLLSTIELNEVVEFYADKAALYEAAIDDYMTVERWLSKGAGKDLINLRDRTEALADVRLNRKATIERYNKCKAKVREASVEILNRIED